MKVCCATSNAGKLREFQLALAVRGASGGGGRADGAGNHGLPEASVEVEPVPGLAGIAPPEETGLTFEENAVAKALYYSRFCEEPVFADDSGLAVDALGSAPGVYSARYAGSEAGDDANNRLLLERMRGVADRAARFVCVIALARRGELLGTFRGEVEGSLTEEPRGAGGFGYDPLFYYPPFGCTFGEAPLADKMQVSHRGRALAQLRHWLCETAPASP